MKISRSQISKQTIIVHGWGGYPEEGWFPWLKTQLEARGYRVSVPQMPNADIPEIEAWVNQLSETVGEPDENLVLIGHSIGCQTILHYLEILPQNQKIGQVILVAPFLELLNLETDSEEEKAIAKPWLETPINYEKVKSHTDRIVALFSNNDPFVPLENIQLFKDRLNAETYIFENRGHFSGSEGTFEIPEVLNLIIK